MPSETTLHHKPAAKSRQPVLPVAQIYEVAEARSFPTGDAAVVVRIGDAECEPHLHGLRASRARWVEIFAGLASADPVFAALLRARLP